jgi:hypothetical protein
MGNFRIYNEKTFLENLKNLQNFEWLKKYATDFAEKRTGSKLKTNSGPLQISSKSEQPFGR